MSVNKVILDTEHGQEVLLDVSQDTVSPGTLARGVTATNAAGKKITGIVDLKTKATAISDSVSGKSVVIEKSGDDSLIGLTLYGKTEQFTTTGAQLANILDTDAYENNGITWSCKNGVVTAKGTASAISHSQDRIKFDIPVVADTYYVSGSANGVNVHIQVTKADNSQRWYNDNSFVLDGTEKQVRIYCQVLEGKTVDTTIYPMLNKGETALPYEPYTGGIPSPNPQYPQELVSVGADGDVEVGVYGGNLLLAKPFEYNGLSSIIKDDGTITVSGTPETNWWNGGADYDEMPIIQKGRYIFSVDSPESFRVGIKFYNLKDTKTPINYRIEPGKTEIVFDIPKPMRVAYFFLENITVNIAFNETIKLMLRPASITDSTFEPYHKQTLSIPTPNGLPAIKVTDSSLATYTDENGNMWCADTIDYERGVYVKRVGEVNVANANVIDWGEGGGGHDFCIPTDTWDVDNYKNRILGAVCTHFPAVSTAQWVVGTMRFSTTNNHGWSGKARIGFRVPSEISTVAKFKEYVGTDCYVQYILATPIEIPLTQEEIAEFSVLHSNYPFTTILNNYNALMDVKYSLHTQTYIDEADNKVRDLVEQNKSLINDLKRVKANAIVQKVEGESVVVSDSSDDALRGLRLFGKTEQFSTTGAQLFDASQLVKLSNDTLDVSEDGYLIVATGGAENTFTNSQYELTDMSRLVGKTVYLKVDSIECSIQVGNPVQVIVYTPSGTIYKGLISGVNKTEIIEVPEDATSIKFCIFANNTSSALGAANTVTVKGLRLVLDTNAEWEPYTGGIPSPNPQYPQDLVSVGDDGDVEVGVYGSNLLDYTEWSKVAVISSSASEWKDYGVAFTASGNDAFTSYNGANCYKVPCKPNTTYTMSWELDTVVSGHVYVFFNGITGNNKLIDAAACKLTFTTPEDATFFTFRVGCFNAGTTITYKNVRINLGDTVLPFEPYTKQTLTALTPNGLPGILVTDASLATYTDADGQMWCADEKDYERGVNVKRVIAESRTKNNVFINSDKSFFFVVLNNAVSTKQIFYCNVAVHKANNMDFGNAWITGDGRLIIGNLDESGNPVYSTTDELFNGIDKIEFIYILATPIETPLSEDELTAYRALHSNYPVTTILNDSGAHMEVKYNADTKNYIDNKFAELQTALVALGGI